MSLCPAECADFTMVEVHQASCEMTYRKINIRSIGFYKCDAALPSPLTATALADLYAAGGIVFSNELVNVQVGEPTYEERKLSDCRPAYEELVEREISFEDRIKVEIQADAGATPPVLENLFLDYDFWQDKIDHQANLNYVFVMCNGDVVAPVDSNGNGLPATFRMNLSYESLSRGGAIEFKAGSLKFLGDPLAMKYKPVINLNAVPELAGKW